ncbi:MAG: type III pantothenate kinase [Tistrella sp.]|jgi:type III pantothenate kinase|uniref:Type III pantothenate kinase n=2 Tax=Tistrella mobilis TaxID=171437 RepID=I3TM13_TISMK|nr:type III pantothenate kinase [Tistrella mobilis]AFK53801.1 pantothenate kinase [Tistrella mobilis KA081020-065]KYO57594.1 type III pantothenate kinase [Tistrella mobilis]MBA74259.1 type III pantothenate kinase [Tistrella sp.]HAE47249.1 type III pantothenate kinase [Tistrella mobilis]
MLLTIDVGNTNTVFAVHDGDGWRGQWRASTDGRRTADEYAVWLLQLFALEGLTVDDVHAVIISSVVPQTKFSLRQLCLKYFRSEPMMIGDPEVNLGLRIDMDRPREVGADRLVNAIAAHKIYGGDLIVIDFGTATTFDVVGADGSYQGGVIAPGINLSLEALHRAAAKLPRIAVERTEKVIGKDTVPAMQAGVFWGYVGLIEGLVRRIVDEYGKPMTVIATGGLAPIFFNATDAIQHADPDITLVGLLEIHRLNISEKA